MLVLSRNVLGSLMIPVILIVTRREISFLKAMNGMEVRLNW